MGKLQRILDSTVKEVRAFTCQYQRITARVQTEGQLGVYTVTVSLVFQDIDNLGYTLLDVRTALRQKTAVVIYLHSPRCAEHTEQRIVNSPADLETALKDLLGSEQVRQDIEYFCDIMNIRTNLKENLLGTTVQ